MRKKLQKKRLVGFFRNKTPTSAGIPLFEKPSAL
jgi:hypothetical protein